MPARGGGAGAGPPEDNTLEGLVRLCRILWFGLLMGQVMFGLVLVAIGGSLWKGPGPSTLETPLSFMLLTLVAAAVVGVVLFRRSFIADVRGQAATLRQMADPIPAIAPRYRAYFITTHGLVEGTSLFALVAYMVTGMTLSLVIVGASIAFFLLSLPAQDRVRRLVQAAIEA
jgi:hypothetical protein